MSIQRIAGKTSTLNSTDATLGAAGVFVGTFEEVISFACLNIAVFADQSSVVDGLEFQWSTNGTDVDASDVTSVFAGVGIAFPISVSARYFRIRYVNGATPQTVFRLGVTLREDGTALVAKALDKPLLGAQFAQITRSVVTAQQPDGTYIPVKTTAGGLLRVDGSGVTQPVTTAGATLATLIPLGYGGSLTAPTYPAIKPLSSYIVPTGKTLKILGFITKTAAVTTSFSLYKRTPLWNFGAVAVATPAAPVGTNRTIAGAGLTLLATYRYKIVAVNALGKTLPSVELVSVLTTTQNAVSLALVLPAGALYMEIYRTLANGAANSQVYLGATDGTPYVDTAADGLLGATTPPVANTTAGSTDGAAYPSGVGCNTVVADTLAAITAATAVDVIYKNAYGARRYLTFTPATAVGGQVELQWSGKANPVADNRILRLTAGQEFHDSGINDINAIGTTPVTGAFSIYGRDIAITAQSAVANSWNQVLLPVPLEFPAGTELVLGISALAAAAAARNDCQIYGTLTQEI